MTSIRRIKIRADNITKDIIKIINNYNKNPICDEIVKRLLAGEYQHSGHFGRVLIDRCRAYKMNTSADGNIIIKRPDDETVLIYLSAECIQNIIPMLLDIVAEKYYPEISELYTRSLNFYRCDRKTISVMETCNEETLVNFMSKNRDNYELLNVQLVKAVKDVARILNVLVNHYNFSHIDLHCNNVFVHRNSSGEFIYKISDFEKSSITINGITVKPREFLRPRKPAEIKNYKNGWYTINKSTDPKPGDIESEGFNFLYKLDSNINIDIYIVILCIAFNWYVKFDIDRLPLFKKLLSRIFNKEDYIAMLDRMRREYNISGPFKPVHHIITKQIRLRRDIYSRILEFEE